MITIISPATTMNFDKNNNLKENSNPYFSSEASYLINELKTKSILQIKDLMNLSDELATLNKNRYENYGLSENPKLQSILAFDGEVFNCMNASDFTLDDFNFANKHFKILSGLYGVLSPFDIIEPYRLEMKAKLETNRGGNLYKFWKDSITKYLTDEVTKHENKIILNLASSEYVKCIDLKVLNNVCDFINIEFKDYNEKTNKFRVVGMYSKQARGYLSRYIIKNKIDDIKCLRNIEINGYKYNQELSKDNNLIFTR